MKKLLLFLSLPTLLLLCGASNKPNEKIIYSPVQSLFKVVIDSFLDSKTDFKSDNTLEVKLKGNPTTGYSWQYNYDVDGIIKEDSCVYLQDEAPKGMMGVGGTYTWTFSPIKEGKVTLNFSYSRQWESVAPLKTASYTYEVDKDLNMKLINKIEDLD